jgi:hypothetical protein
MIKVLKCYKLLSYFIYFFSVKNKTIDLNIEKKKSFKCSNYFGTHFTKRAPLTVIVAH